MCLDRSESLTYDLIVLVAKSQIFFNYTRDFSLDLLKALLVSLIETQLAIHVEIINYPFARNSKSVS